MKVKDLFAHLEEHKKVCKELGFSAPYLVYRIPVSEKMMADSIDDMVDEIHYCLLFRKDIEMDKKELLEELKEVEIDSSYENGGSFKYKGVRVILYEIR